MNHSQEIGPQSPIVYHDDEIDLMELFAVLWRGKWLVIGLVALSAIVTFILLKFFVTSYYKVEMVIDQPTNYQMQRLQPSLLIGGEGYQVTPIDLETVYSRVLSHANSLYVKRQFWKSYAGILDDVKESEIAEDKDFKSFVKRLRVVGPDIKNPKQTTSMMELESVEPSNGVSLLNEYQAFIGRYTVEQLSMELRAGYEAALFMLNEDYQSLKEREKQKIEDQLVVLTEALGVARSLGIVETPYEQVENVELKMLDNRTYLLGTRVLDEEIKSLKAREEKALASFVPQLREMENWKRQIESDLKQLDNIAKKVDAFVVVSPPESSLNPVKPNKLMILIGMVFLSGMLGVIIVFVRHGMKTYQARDQV